MKRKMYPKLTVLIIAIIAAAVFIVVPDTEVSASTRPSLADLQAQLTSLQNQIGSLSPGDPFIGEVRLFGGNFAPRGWAFCDGQLLPVAQYQALFSILGTKYGGDGMTNFALPDLRGRIPMGQGNGAGLTQRNLGQKLGAEIVMLNVSQMPQHTHMLMTSSDGTSTDLASDNLLAATASSSIYKTNGTPNTAAAGGSIASAGGIQPVSVIQPSTVLSYIIALNGIYPERN